MLKLVTSFAQEFQVVRRIVVVVVVLVMHAPLPPSQWQKIQMTAIAVANRIAHFSPNGLVYVITVLVIPMSFATRHTATSAVLAYLGFGEPRRKRLSTSNALVQISSPLQRPRIPRL